MNSRNRERYKALCEISEIQGDPDKLAKLASQINEILKSEIRALRKRPLKARKGGKQRTA
jgi:hypothetical protein